MSDEPAEGFETDPVESVSEPVAEAAGIGEMDFSSGEGMVSLGGAIVLVVYLIFELILRDYFVATLTIALAVVVLILPRINRDLVEKVAPLSVLMKLLGYLLVISGVTEVIDDLRFDQLDEAAAIIGGLAAYAGYAVTFLGARSIKT